MCIKLFITIKLYILLTFYVFSKKIDLLRKFCIYMENSQYITEFLEIDIHFNIV